MFANLCQTLTADLGIRESSIIDAERRLGLHVPESLASMLVLAGYAPEFSSTDNHLLSPEEWTVDDERLIIFESNEGQLVWAIDANEGEDADPIV